MSKIVHKKSSVPGKIPLVADLDYGELALNYADGKLFYKNTANSIQAIGGSGGTTLSRQIYTATSNQTVFNINYSVGYVDVYLNGVKLVNGTEFTATTGSEITLATGAVAGDIVDIVAGLVFTETGGSSAGNAYGWFML